MNLFQEYEQAKANPLTSCLKALEDWFDEESMVSIFGQDYNPEIEIPIVEIIKKVNDNGGYYLRPNTAASLLYKDDYSDYWMQFARACLNPFIPFLDSEEKDFINSNSAFINYVDEIFLNELKRKAYHHRSRRSRQSKYAYHILSAYLGYNGISPNVSLDYSIFYYISFSGSNEKIIYDAFMFMCQYRFVPESFIQYNPFNNIS